MDLIDRQAAIELILSGKVDDDSWVYECPEECNSFLDWAAEEVGKMPTAQPEIVRCKDCRWGREVCGNIECFVDSNIPPEYHGYEWFCPNGERRIDGGLN